MFVVGVSIALSLASHLAHGESSQKLIQYALRRSFFIFACGVAIDYLRFPAHHFPYIGFQQHLQFSGALQLIAICYLLAFLIYLWSSWRGVVIGIVLLNLLYLALLYFYPVPGCGQGSLNISCNFPDYLDEVVLGTFEWGLKATVVGAIPPATSSVLFGVLAGALLLHGGRQSQQVVYLLIVGAILIAAGQLLMLSVRSKDLPHFSQRYW